jgi:hypothetical protein
MHSVAQVNDGADTTASLPVTGAACEPPRKFSAPVTGLSPVGVLSRLKKKNELLATSSHDSILHNAPVTIPVCAIRCLPTIITVIYAHSFSPLLLFLQSSGMSSSSSASLNYSEASSKYSIFLATSAADFNIVRLMSMSRHFKAWQQTVQPRINETKVLNHSSCLHGAQDPLQVIRLKNPEKIWLFLLVHLSRPSRQSEPDQPCRAGGFAEIPANRQCSARWQRSAGYTPKCNARTSTADK